MSHEQAAPLFEAAIEGLERRLGPDHPDVLSTKVGLSGSYLELRRYPEAQILLEPVIDSVRRVFGERHGQTLIALYNLACVHANSGRIDLALDYLRKSIALGWAYPVSAPWNPVFANVGKYYAAAESQALRGLDDEALRSLARASELGFDDIERLENDLAFAKLRGRAEFATIAKAARRRAL